MYPEDMDVLFPMAVTPQLTKIGSRPSPFGNSRNDMESFYPLIRAMNTHDIGRERGGIEMASIRISAKVVAFAFTHDPMYPTRRNSNVCPYDSKLNLLFGQYKKWPRKLFNGI